MSEHCLFRDREIYYPHRDVMGNLIHPGSPLYLMSYGPNLSGQEELMAWIWTPERMVLDQCSGFAIVFIRLGDGTVFIEVFQTACEKSLDGVTRLGRVQPWILDRLCDVRQCFGAGRDPAYWEGTLEQLLWKYLDDMEDAGNFATHVI